MALAPSADASVVRRLVPLVLGMVLVGGGVSVMIRADVGVAPYDVLTTGLAELTGMAIGVAAVCVPVGLVVCGLLLGGRTGPGTAITMVTVGPVIALALALVPEVEALPIRIVMFAIGSVCVALGITAVVIAQLGPGPAEVLMLAVAAKGVSVAVARTGIEISLVAIGWAMGGQVGVGTIVFALLIGPALRWLLDAVGYSHRPAVLPIGSVP